MKLLHVIGSLNPLTGGPCQVIRSIVPELESLGITNEVVCLDSPEAPFIGKDLFKLYCFGPGKTSWCYSKMLLSWLSTNVSRYDCIIVHGLWLYHSYAVSAAVQQLKNKKKKREGRVPKVYIMPHGMLDPYFQRAPERKLKALRNVFYWALIEAKVVNEADGLLFTCQEELHLARETFKPYKPKQEISVGLGIAAPPPYTTQMKRAFQEKCPTLQDQPYILFLSRIHQKKGLDLLLRAYKELAGAVPEFQTELVDMGAGGDQMRMNHSAATSLPKLVVAGPGEETSFGQEVLELVASSKELQSAVFFTGMLSGDAKWGAFYGCEAFVLPSHQENFGIAVVEALACNKPVLITKQVNIWREILNLDGALVVDDTLEDVQKLLKTWVNLSSDKKIQLGQGARSAYESFFSINQIARRLAKAIAA
ncbi:glycosyltransferase [Pontibacter pamirensis]|uniref:glycosyltransferase n=1 Tax=Pontibacter pamirensis TaxID=2562824 RepID=UPI001389A507|nr:glycosyltransferase [Pontibacter pamirensis]